MSRLHPRFDSSWDLATAVSLVVVVVAAGIGLMPPPPHVDPARALQRSLRDAQRKAAQSRDSAATQRKRVTDRTWPLQPEALGVEVMEAVRRVADRRGLQVANFSVGRPIPSAGLRQVPFSVTLDGAFVSVLETASELEAPNGKLALSAIKMAPSNEAGPDGAAGGPGRVTATLTITAFLEGEGT